MGYPWRVNPSPRPITPEPTLTPPTEDHARWQVGKLAEPFLPIGPDITCGEVYDLLSNDEAKFAVAVVDQGRPIGIVGRLMVLDQFARLYRREVLMRRSVTRMMDAAPLIVDAGMMVDELSRRIATDKPAALHSGVIVMRHGLYVGVCSGIAVMRRVAEQARNHANDLAAARDAAEAANRAKSAFLANISHELRTPLNAILGFSDMIRLGIHGTTPAKYVEYAGDIRSSGQLLLELINELLDLSKAEAGRLDICEEDIDVRAAIADCLRMVEVRARGMRHGLSVNMHDRLPRWRGDGRMLRQILLNLLSNAIKFTPVGGFITIDARLTPERAFELAVSDSGIGIAAADMARVLEPFTQVDNKHNRRYDGTGLGLPLVKRLVDLHGGQLTIDSELGVGTRMTIVFPADRTVRDHCDAASRQPALALAVNG